MTDFKTTVLEAVAQAYPGDFFPLDYEQAKRHEIGDGLADFIRMELEEGVDWTADGVSRQDIIEEAVRVMEMARRDINAVIEALSFIDLDIREEALIPDLMGKLGFAHGESGGGCTWYTREAPNGSYVAVTDQEGVSAPTDLGTSILVGVYDENGDCQSLDSWNTLQEWIEKEERK